MTVKKPLQGAVWLGFDLGTQSARAIAVSGSGSVLAQSSQPLASRRNGPRHEQDPEEWWRAVLCVSRAVLAGLPSSSIRGLAVDGTSGTILLVDRSGNPLTSALMYDDVRATAEAECVNQAGSAVWESLGYRMQPSWALPKLLWLLREHREAAPRVRVAHQADFISSRFAGCALPSDSRNALKTGYDLLNERWPSGVLEELGLSDQIMPSVARPGTQIGTVGAEAAAATGIPAGTPIIAGTTDGCAAQIAAGALDSGNWNSALGTTLVLKGATRELIRDPAGIIYSHRSPEGTWLPGGASNTGTAVLTQRFPRGGLDALSEQAVAREPVSITAYPLASRGERFPFLAPDAEGFVLGEPSDDVELYTALLQGAGFVQRLCFDYLDLLKMPMDGEISLTGGAARSHFWRQLCADVLWKPVRLPENAESAFGMAVLAAALGRRLSEAAGEMVRIREVIDPRPNRMARLNELYLQFVEELARRGWLHSQLLKHTRQRANAH